MFSKKELVQKHNSPNPKLSLQKRTQIQKKPNNFLHPSFIKLLSSLKQTNYQTHCLIINQQFTPTALKFTHATTHKDLNLGHNCTNPVGCFNNSNIWVLRLSVSVGMSGFPNCPHLSSQQLCLGFATICVLTNKLKNFANYCDILGTILIFIH